MTIPVTKTIYDRPLRSEEFNDGNKISTFAIFTPNYVIWSTSGYKYPKIGQNVNNLTKKWNERLKLGI